MAKCANTELFKKIGQKLMDDMSEIEFVLYNELPNCKTINAGRYLSASGTVSFDRYGVPDNKFECNPMACVNSGTLVMGAASESIVYKAQFDAREFAAGLMTFYIKGNGTAGTVTVLVSDSSTFTNANSYSVSYPATNDYVPIMVDFNDSSMTEVGTGWDPSASGAYIKFTFGANSSGVGLSSITILDQYSDLATSDVVKIGCLTDISGTIDIPAIARQCSTASYDTSNLSFTRTINGKLLTPNYHKLNPMYGKMKSQEGSQQYTVRKTVANDGTVIISDMNLDDCGPISAQRTDACEADLAMLTRLYTPVRITEPIGSEYFQIINDEANGTATFYFSTELAGKEVLISYPKKVNVDRYAANVDNVGDVRVMARFNGSYVDNRGSMDVVYTLPNVLITSFPWNITRTEQDFSFTISIQPDGDGNYWYMDKIVL